MIATAFAGDLEPGRPDFTAKSNRNQGQKQVASGSLQLQYPSNLNHF